MTHAILIVLALAAASQEKAPSHSPPSSGYVEPQDPDRPAIPSADLKALKDTNVFSPRKTFRKPTGSDSRKPGPPPEKPRPKPLVVTGIIFDTQSKAYQVVVEDRNTEKMRLITEPRFLKTGDTVLVYTIESVEAEKVVVRYGDSKKELKVGDPMPDAGIKAPEGSDVSSEEGAEAPSPDAKPEAKTEPKTSETPSLDEASRKKILEERMKKLGKKRKSDEEN